MKQFGNFSKKKNLWVITLFDMFWKNENDFKRLFYSHSFSGVISNIEFENIPMNKIEFSVFSLNKIDR